MYSLASLLGEFMEPPLVVYKSCQVFILYISFKFHT